MISTRTQISMLIINFQTNNSMETKRMNIMAITKMHSTISRIIRT